MAIHNIHILHEPVQPGEMNHSVRKMREHLEARRIVEHRAGKHPWGSKRRDCPLCVAGK